MPLIVTDGNAWFGIDSVMVLEVSHEDYGDLCEGMKVSNVTPTSIVSTKSSGVCPGCGSWEGPCPNCSCVRTEDC